MSEMLDAGSTEVVDLQFSLQGLRIPVDYADALAHAVQEALPWFSEDPLVGMHLISGLSPGGEFWNVSRRSQLILRLPRERIEAATVLAGKSLIVAGEPVEVGGSSVRELRHTPVIYCRFVAFGQPDPAGKAISEEAFVAACHAAFTDLNACPDMICGKAQRANTDAGLISGYSLLLSGLDAETNLHIQRHGLGVERKRGCGIFVPHKSFAAVRTLE